MTICREVLEEALGHNVPQEDADKLFAKINRMAKEVQQNDPSLGYNDAIVAVQKELAETSELKAILAKRNSALNETKVTENVDYILGTWEDKPWLGLKALTVGVQANRRGARYSIGSAQMNAEDRYLAGMLADINKVDGAFEAYTRGDLDDELVGVLSALSSKGDLSGFSEMSVNTGKAIRKWQEYGRNKANQAGAWVGVLDDYIATNIHNIGAVAKNRETWVEFATEHFDLPRMANQMEVDLAEMPDILRNMWRGLSSGVHLKPEAPQTSLKGLQSIGKKLSHERLIHMKSPESWLAYNRTFGAGSVHEAIASGLRKQARATALMDGLGPNYELNWDKTVDSVLRSMTKKGDSDQKIKEFQSKAKTYKRIYLSQVDGSLDIPGNDAMATYGASIRFVQTTSALGGATLSSITDIGTVGLGAKYNGINSFEAMGAGLGKLFKGAPSAEKVELYADLGLLLKSMAGKVVGTRFSPDDSVAGKLGDWQNKFFKYNLQNHWTDAWKEGNAEVLSRNLARNADKTFKELDGRLQQTLGLYGIDPGKWDIFRKTEISEIEGAKFMAPKMLDELPDEEFSKYLSDLSINPTKAKIRDLRDETARQFRLYFSDQNDYMLLEPDAATLGLMKQGLQKGTGPGEAIRFMGQFKSFTVAFSQKIVGREAKQSGFMGVAQMIALATLFGYGASAAKDLAKGRVPRDPTDPRTWLASLQQGGGLGLYGDLLFSQIADRRYKDALLSLAGPTASDINQMFEIIAKTAQEQADSEAPAYDTGAEALRFTQQNTPFLNLFYTKILLDYSIFYHLQEWMNPGSLARMEANLQERSGQEFIVPPSEVVN